MEVEVKFLVNQAVAVLESIKHQIVQQHRRAKELDILINGIHRAWPVSSPGCN